MRAVLEGARYVGEAHPRAVLVDHEVELVRELARGGMTHRELASKFDVSLHCIRSICCGRRRRFKTLYAPE